MKTPLRLVLVAAVLVVIPTACSSSEPTDTIDVTLKSFSFDDSSYNVPAGETITITMKNDATIAHEWVILRGGVTIDSENDLPATEEELLADFVYWEEEVDGGDTQTVTFVAPAAGEYQIVCAIEGHFDSGMKGTLTATAAEE